MISPTSDENNIIHNAAVEYEGKKVILTLTYSILYWKSIEGGQENKVELKDVISASVHPRLPNILFVHTCIVTRNGNRERKTLWFINEDESKAKTWIRAIRSVLEDIPIQEIDSSPKKRFLIIYNKAEDFREIWLDTIRPMLEIAFIEFEVHEINQIGEAKDIVSKLKLDMKWHAIVCVGGDPLVNDTLNGIMQRDDWKLAVELPIAVIPTSGRFNSLSFAVSSADTVTATYYALRGKSYPMDVFSVLRTVPNTSQSDRFYGITNLTWGMEDIGLSDGKVASKFKFAFSALKTVVSAKRCKGEVMILPAPLFNKVVCEKDCKFCSKPTLKERSLSQPPQPVTPFTASTSKVNWKETAIGITEMLEDDVDRKESTFSIEESKDDAIMHELEMELNDDESVDILLKSKESNNGPPLVIWKEDDPLFSIQSPDWKTIGNEFAFFVATKLFSLGGSSVIAPWSHLSDGYIDVILIKSNNLTNSMVAKLLASIQAGEHLKEGSVDYFKAKGFSLTSNSEGIVIIDGIEVDVSGTIRVEVHSALVQIIGNGMSTPVN